MALVSKWNASFSFCIFLFFLFETKDLVRLRWRKSTKAIDGIVLVRSLGIHWADRLPCRWLHLIPDANLITLRFWGVYWSSIQPYCITTPYFLVSLNLLNIYANCIDFALNWEYWVTCICKLSLRRSYSKRWDKKDQTSEKCCDNRIGSYLLDFYLRFF